MGSPASDKQLLELKQLIQTDTIGWAFVDAESNDNSFVYGQSDEWFDGSVHITVWYRSGRAAVKAMEIRQPQRSKVWQWVNWLRGITGL
jgi:hypothetical protein